VEGRLKHGLVEVCAVKPSNERGDIAARPPKREDLRARGAALSAPSRRELWFDSIERERDNHAAACAHLFVARSPTHALNTRAISFVWRILL